MIDDRDLNQNHGYQFNVLTAFTHGSYCKILVIEFE